MSGSKSSDGELGLAAVWAIAVGGMVGGGIFSTLGVVISSAGHWAALSFVLGGLESHDGVCAEIAAGTGLETAGKIVL